MVAVSVKVTGDKRVQDVLRELSTGSARLRGMRYSISPSVPWGAFVTRGTAPHTIRPRYKKALYWEGLEHPVAVVRHPGTAPNPYLEVGLNSRLPALKQGIVEAAEAVASGSPAGTLPNAFAREVEGVLEAIRAAAPVGTGPSRTGLRLRESLYIIRREV